jgi:hypothetical protein
VGRRASLDTMEKRKILPLSHSDLGCPARTPALFRLVYVSYTSVHLEPIKQSSLCSEVSGKCFYADDVNLLGDNTDIIKQITQTLIDASKEVGLGVNTEKTKYMLYVDGSVLCWKRGI